MLRSIISLAARHWREHYLREALCLLAVAAVTALLYAGNLSNSGSVSVAGVARQLGNIRYAIVLLWIAVTAVYTLVTAFRGYGDARRCYATLLLPACSGTKYAWEWLRTMIMFPLAALAVIWCVDAAVVRLMIHVRPMLAEVEESASTLWDAVTAVGEPLNYIPYNIYLVVWFNSVDGGAVGSISLRVGGDGTRLCRDVVDAGVVVFAHGRLCDKLCVVCGAAGGGICAVVPEI